MHGGRTPLVLFQSDVVERPLLLAYSSAFEALLSCPRVQFETLTSTGLLRRHLYM
jgi:hypothetical protein